jgi:hypothetical protein
MTAKRASGSKKPASLSSKTARSSSKPTGRAMGGKLSDRAPEHDDPEGVDSWLAALDHPLKPVIEAIRTLILEADSEVTEGVKWNSPSFYLDGWFATVNAHGKHGILVVLHHGAKPATVSKADLAIDDPRQLLRWHSGDRVSTAFASMTEFVDRKGPFSKIVKLWLARQRRLSRPTEPSRA